MFKSCDIDFFFSAAWGYSYAGGGQVRVALKMCYVSGGLHYMCVLGCVKNGDVNGKFSQVIMDT